MEDERTKELAYLFDRDENEVESLVEAAEAANAEEAAPEETKEEATEEVKKVKKKKEHFPTKTTINLFYKVDKTTGPVTAMLYIMFALVLILALGKFGVYDIMQQVTNLENKLSDTELDVQTMMVATKDYNKVKSEYNRLTQGYLTNPEKPIDRLDILDMLEKTVYKKSTVKNTAITSDSIFLSYTGLDLEGTSALIKEIEAYDWVKKVTIQNASLSTNKYSGDEIVSTTMVIETYATIEEVPADE